jgi:hypothetical protein
LLEKSQPSSSFQYAILPDTSVTLHCEIPFPTPWHDYFIEFPSGSHPPHSLLSHTLSWWSFLLRMKIIRWECSQLPITKPIFFIHSYPSSFSLLLY